MNTIVERRMQNLVISKFLKSAVEIKMLSLLVDAIEKSQPKNIEKILLEKQTESRQMELINIVQTKFTSGENLLKFVNQKTNHMSFEDLKTHKLVELNKFIHEAKVEDIMSALNKASVKTKNIAPPARKKVFKNKSNSNVEIIIKK
jgi:hypothetical protein